MAQAFNQGDKVQWASGSGTATGTVQERVTEETTVEGNTVAASEDDPRYLVKNDSTGNVSGHKTESLSKVDGDSGDNRSNGHDSTDDSEKREKVEEFEKTVNMTAKEIEDWLETEESQSVGQEDSDGNIKGRKSGQHIIKILNKKKSDYTDEDYDRIKKVVAYVHRHLAQKPSGDIESTDWCYSLKNWGHDPCKKS